MSNVTLRRRSGESQERDRVFGVVYKIGLEEGNSLNRFPRATLDFFSTPKDTDHSS